MRVVPLGDAKGRVTGGLSVALDVSDRRRIERVDGSRPAELDAVTDATRALARSVDPTAARTAVCEGARAVAEAPVAALFEPAPGGATLVAKASVGAEMRRASSCRSRGEGGAALAFARAEEIFVALGDGEAEADREFMRRARARAVLWHPVVRDRAAIGVLAIAWREEVAGVSLRISTMIDLLGAEAAVAIGRADLLGQLEHLARTDGLTGLPNRRHWEQQLPRELARAWRDGQRVCVAMLDLDYFKDYNDRRGHQAGDKLLREAAVAWRVALRPYDILARYGGEEFSVILPGCDLDDALEAGRAPAGRHARGRVVLGGDRRVGRRGAAGDAGRPRRRGALPGQARRAQPHRSPRTRSDARVTDRGARRAPRVRRRTAIVRRDGDGTMRALAALLAPPRCAVCGRPCPAARADLRPAAPRARGGPPAAGRSSPASARSPGRRRTRASPASSSRRSSSARGSGSRGRSARRSPAPAPAPGGWRDEGWVVVAVPAAPARLRRRGFDPAELIADRARRPARPAARPAAAPRRRPAPGRAARAARAWRRRRGCAPSAPRAAAGAAGRRRAHHRRDARRLRRGASPAGAAQVEAAVFARALGARDRWA